MEVIDDILEEGKGVIIPSIHIGNFIEGWLGAWIMKDDKYTIAAVASMSNMALFNEIINRPVFDRAIPVNTTKYGNIKDDLIGHLKKNHIVIIMFDYTKETQFRVPFLHGEYPYLQNTPQSVASMHKLTGAPIVPAICHPMGNLDKTYIEFLDNKSIMEISKTYWDAPKKELYGRISTEINKILNPYVKIYAHLWEEIMNFATFRIADKIRFESNTSLIDFITQTKGKMETIIEYSYEPERKDEEIIRIINQTFDEAKKMLKNPETILRSRKSVIRLSKMDGISEILKLARIARKELSNKNELECSKIFQMMIEKIKEV
jgi:hypothetical protein